MAKKQKVDVSNNDLQENESQYNSSDLKRISLCLGVMALRMTHHKFKMDKDRIPFLTKLGFDRHEIAAILDTTPLSVSVVQTKMKKNIRTRTKPDAEN